MRIERIAVVGAGIMGRGIAYVSAVAGYDTALYDVNADALERAQREIEGIVTKGIEAGKVDRAVAGKMRMSTHTDLEAAARRADLVIEAAPEDMRLKIELFERLERMCGPDTIFATNTSALSVTEMAASTKRAPQVCGMHFFNPVHRMKLIELVRGLETSPETLAACDEVSKRMGKETVIVRESPGFVTSRVNALIGNEAFRMLEEGVASATDIDKALKLGLNHPMGPFELVDLVGLDTRLSILRFLNESLGDRFRPSPLLVQYVKAGRLGRKSGRGVYDYVDGKPVPAGSAAPATAETR
jgi:3-hydroxybutyryl-CoA dehydrogenase